MGTEERKGPLSVVGSVCKWLAQQSLGAVLTAVVLIFASPTIIKNIAESYPTCERPVGLTRLALSDDDRVEGNWSPPPASGSYPKDLYHPLKAFDQNLGTVWALPRSAAQSGQGNDFKLAFHAARDVELVCAINGSPVDPSGYQRADRVREATVTYHCDGDDRTQRVYLQSRSDADMQLPQQIGARCSSMTSMSMSVTASFEGWDVTKLGSDQVEKATERIALADVLFYGWGSDLNASQHFIQATEWFTG